MASEAVKFHVLCYYHADASFGAIGGAICMIEIRKGRVFLSFIHGSRLDDPATRLSGTAKFKRSARVESPAAAADPALRDLVVQAAALRPWD